MEEQVEEESVGVEAGKGVGEECLERIVTHLFPSGRVEESVAEEGWEVVAAVQKM